MEKLFVLANPKFPGLAITNEPAMADFARQRGDRVQELDFATSAMMEITLLPPAEGATEAMVNINYGTIDMEAFEAAQAAQKSEA